MSNWWTGVTSVPKWLSSAVKVPILWSRMRPTHPKVAEPRHGPESGQETWALPLAKISRSSLHTPQLPLRSPGSSDSETHQGATWPPGAIWPQPHPLANSLGPALLSVRQGDWTCCKGLSQRWHFNFSKSARAHPLCSHPCTLHIHPHLPRYLRR